MWQQPLDADLPVVSRQRDAAEAPEPERPERPHLEAVPPLPLQAPPLWELHVPAVPTRQVSFFRRRLFLTLSEEPITGARSLQWCLGWITAIVCASAAIAAVGFQVLAPPLLLGLLAGQLGTAAFLLYMLGDAARRHEPPERTTALTYGTALAAVATLTEGGIAILAGGLALLARWTGSALDPVRGPLLLIVVGLVAVVVAVLGASWMIAALTKNLRLQPGEKATLLLEAAALMAISFVVLLAW